MASEPLTIASVQLALRQLETLRITDPLNPLAVAHGAKELERFFWKHAEELIVLADLKVNTEQCTSCLGLGKTVEWIASDEQRLHRCGACGGTGRRPLAVTDGE